MSQRHGLRARRRHGEVARRSHVTNGLQAGPAERLYGGELSKEAVMTPDLLEGSIGHGHILPGAVDLDLFASTIVPPRVLGALPPLPDADYPEGMLAFLTTDGKLYRNRSEVWTAEVDGADILADSITAGQIAAGAIGTDQLAADAVIANVVNVGGTVTINEDGIEIQDAFGVSAMTAQGFGGSWLSFLMSGLYNNQFQYGSNVAMTYAQLPSAGEVPYWYFNTRSHTTISATRVAAASAPGDSVISIKQTVGDPGVEAYGLLHQQGLIRCQGGRGVVARVAWRAVGPDITETQRIRVTLIWLDKDETILSTSTVYTEERTATGSAGVYDWSYTAPIIAPGDANYFVIVVGGDWPLGSSVGTTSIELAEVDCQVADYENHLLELGIFTIADEDGVSFPDQLVIDNGAGDAIVRVEGQLSATTHLAANGNITANADGEAISLSANGYIVVTERAAGVPGAADANTCRLFAVDNGSGKVSLRVRFPSGAATLATET